MRVIVHPADNGGCGAYRMVWPGQALAAQGHDVHVETDWKYAAIWHDNHFGQSTVDGLFNTPDADVVVLQRPLHRNRVELIDALHAAGCAVVVEIDDDFHAIHQRNMAWKHTNPLHDRDKNRDWLMKACRRADLVVTTTPALAARYGEHGRVVVIPNYVPEWYTTIERPAHDGVIVGWSGSVATHPDDLQVLGDALADQRFHVVGTGLGVEAKIGIDPVATGWLELDKYPLGMAGFDVGVVPLALTAFNEAKSNLKGIEFAAVGVPFVASPTEPYRTLAADGIGWLAHTPDEWSYLVNELVNDHDMRAELSTAWRAEIAANYTIERNAFKWMDAWTLALDNSTRREKVA